MGAAATTSCVSSGTIWRSGKAWRVWLAGGEAVTLATARSAAAGACPSRRGGNPVADLERWLVDVKRRWADLDPEVARAPTRQGDEATFLAPERKTRGSRIGWDPNHRPPPLSSFPQLLKPHRGKILKIFGRVFEGHARLERSTHECWGNCANFTIPDTS